MRFAGGLHAPRKSPPNRRVYQKHGLHALKNAIKEANGQGDWLESLGEVGVALKACKADLIADLGGVVSVQEVAVIDLATRTRLMLESVDRWLLQQPSLVNKSRRQLFPVVLQRQQLADSLARYMTTLGLERRTSRNGRTQSTTRQVRMMTWRTLWAGL